MKSNFVVLVLFFIVSCVNNKKVDIGIESINDSAFVQTTQELIHPELREGIIRLLSPKEYEKYPDIPIEESCIIIYSWIDKERSAVNFSDSTIKIFYKTSEPKTEDYKGIINIDGYNVAIFDFGNFIYKYVNFDSLKQVPLTTFKSYPVENYMIPVMKYYLENGELNYWCP